MDVIVTAGGIPRPDEPLYPLTQGKSKALLEVAGKPMIQWVLDALGGSEMIEHVMVIGLPPTPQITCRKPLTWFENQGGMVANILHGGREIIKNNPACRGILVASSDVPGLTAEMVDWLAKIVAASDYDVYYNVIARADMEKEFPGSRRTYMHLKDCEVTGGDVNAISADLVRKQSPVWNRLIETRKNPLKQAAILGFDTLLLILLGWMSLAQAEAVASKRLDVRGKVIRCPYAPMGMDVDKPRQLELLQAYLANKKA